MVECLWKCDLIFSKFNYIVQLLILIPSLLQPGFEGKNCIADEHYLPTFFKVRMRISIVKQVSVLTGFKFQLIG